MHVWPKATERDVPEFVRWPENVHDSLDALLSERGIPIRVSKKVLQSFNNAFGDTLATSGQNSQVSYF